MKKALLASLVALSAFSTFACGSSGSGSTGGSSGDGGTCARSSTGTLAVNVTGLPAGVDASVTVTGPGGAQTVKGSKTLTAIQSGDYTVLAANVGQTDPIVRRAFKATASVATTQLCDGQTVTIDVTYAPIATSNKIWWGSTNGTNDTLAWSSSQLGASGAPDPAVAASTAGTLPGAFDKDGNLWVIDGTAGSVGIKRYTADTLATSGAKTPDIVLSSDAFVGGTPGPVSMAFDPKGDLWVGILYAQQVVEFDGTQLTATGTVAPKVTLSNVATPSALAFDVKGNLWVGSGDSVVEYLASRLSASTNAGPDTTITAQTPEPVVGPLTNVLGLAFTADDHLWVDYNGTIARIDNLVTGTVTPEIQIKTDVLGLPSGIALDESGGMWMAYAQGKLAKLGATQLAASGSVTPEVVITSNTIGSATMPALFPAPASLPLYSALK